MKVSRSKSSVPCVVEELGMRRLYSTIALTGTSGADDISLTIVGQAVQVTFNGTVTNYTAVQSITISAGGGDDNVTIDPSIAMGCVISGNSGNDNISGGSGPDQITGNDGNDTILGNASRDTISGNNGDDDLYGGASSDVLYGGTGADALYAGSGGNALYQNDSANTPDSAQDVAYLNVSNQGNDTWTIDQVAPDWDYIVYLQA